MWHRRRLGSIPGQADPARTLIYANDPSVSKPITITFAPSLDNQAITLTDSLPSSVWRWHHPGRGRVCVSLPRVAQYHARHGAGVPADLEVLTIRSADNTIKSFRLTNIPDSRNPGLAYWSPLGKACDQQRDYSAILSLADSTALLFGPAPRTEAGTLSNTRRRLGNFVSETTVAGIQRLCRVCRLHNYRH